MVAGFSLCDGAFRPRRNQIYVSFFAAQLREVENLAVRTFEVDRKQGSQGWEFVGVYVGYHWFRYGRDSVPYSSNGYPCARLQIKSTGASLY